MSFFVHYLAPLLISIVVAFLGLRLWRKLGLLDKPGNDLKNTRKPVPTIQGIFVYLSFFVIIALCFPSIFHSNIFRGLFVGSLPIVIFELIEELNYLGKINFKIPPFFRLMAHIFAGFLAIYIGHFGSQELIIGAWRWLVPQWIFAMFFVLRSILCINAINRFDGIYAQASGVSCIGFLTIFLLIQYVVFGSYTNFSPENLQILMTVKYMSRVLFGIALVSTIVEFKPLGLVRDVGIMFYGFALAYLSVVGGAKIGTLIVALSLVIFDAIRVGLRRIFRARKSPLRGDYTHLHHRLMGLGWKRREIRVFVRLWSIFMMILILLQGTDRINKLIIFLMMALVFFGINYYLFVVKKLPYGLTIKKE